MSQEFLWVLEYTHTFEKNVAFMYKCKISRQTWIYSLECSVMFGNSLLFLVIGALDGGNLNKYVPVATEVGW